MKNQESTILARSNIVETESITLYLLVVSSIICTTTILYIMWAETNYYFFFPYYSYFISFLSIIFRIHINISPPNNSSTKISEHNKTRGEYLILIQYIHNDIPTRLIIYHICKIYNILIKKKKKENKKEKTQRPPQKDRPDHGLDGGHLMMRYYGYREDPGGQHFCWLVRASLYYINDI